MTETLAVRLERLLSEVGRVTAVDAESLVVQVGSTRASIQVVNLADGLDMLAITQLVALDLPNTESLRTDVEEYGAQLNFGSLRRSDPLGVTTDVLQYYTFPVNGLEDIPLLTVLHIMLSAGADAARKLVGDQ
ncbi:hypothetical protein QSJ18_01955 [Gordonia sp. ABSL1-1]|uniref:hypothetical protein n=1 Tax=Gordonia sp. ABSL1-1 TaxID=3053923 RepID=UPI002572EE17|nr:hypothetical protein [Gordonia sp. ABSL1-1]MDL9935500.1 hypothetical protein [Gordonia sp. ABSL1-1]